jgi:hypothetical protein
MEFFDFIFAGVTALAIKVVPEIVSHTVGVIKRELNNIFPGISKTYTQARQTVDVKAEELSDIDKEITEREKSVKRSENAKDRNEIEELELRRQEAYKEYQAAQGETVQQEVSESSESFKESKLREGNENKLLYHTGLITLKKTCPSCGMAMRLQHRTIENPKFSDFFWQCTGYYAGTRCKTFSFQPRDINLFHRNDIDEINIDNKDLITIASHDERHIDNRLKNHLGETDVDVLCPVHLIPMQHKEKPRTLDIPFFDRHFLYCPNTNCSQTTKLKSFPQVAAYLRRKEGKGILD